MTLSIAESIETVRNKIATFTSENVIVGMPDDSESGLFLFPYKFSETPLAQNNNLPTTEGALQAYRIKCLLVPSPSINFMALGKGYDYLFASGVIRVNAGIIQVGISVIPTEILNGLFISAGVTSRLSIPIEISCTSTV